MSFSVRIFVLLLFGTLSLASVPFSSSLDDSPLASTAKKISIPGVHNAGKVSDHLYRGSQPSLNDLSELKKLGITSIIDLRAEASSIADQERVRAEALGMRFVRIPIGGFSTPKNSDLARFFQTLRDSPTPTIFVHCEFGQDRTGVMIAAYRIAVENWSSDQALSEMMVFGFNRPWHPSMVTYVRNLPNRLQFDAELKNIVKLEKPATLPTSPGVSTPLHPVL